MVGELDDLHEPAFLVGARHDEPGLLQRRPEVVVHLVPVPMSLVHNRLAVRLARASALREFDCLGPKAHGPPKILDLLLLRQQVDHRVWRLRIHLRRVRTLESHHVPRELRDCDVHPEADTEVRDALLARDPAGGDLALPTA